MIIITSYKKGLLSFYVGVYITCYIILEKRDFFLVVSIFIHRPLQKSYNEEVCKAIQHYGAGASLEIKIPIRWFAFELTMPQKALCQ